MIPTQMENLSARGKPQGHFGRDLRTAHEDSVFWNFGLSELVRPFGFCSFFFHALWGGQFR
jgi:hypothetical protein